MVWPWLIMGGAALAVSAVREYWWPTKEGAKPPAGATVYQSFEAFAEAVVVPRIGKYDDDIRLDFGTNKYGGKPIYWFERNNRIWAINGDSRFGPLIAAYNWMRNNPGADPFWQEPTTGKGKRHTLSLKPKVGWSGPKWLYIYDG